MTADSRLPRIPAAIAGAFTSRPRLAALLIYLGFSAILFGRAAAPHFTTIYLGRGIDQAFFIWCLVWWPYAIAHHLNPFVTKLIFAPAGFNLTWSTSIPLLSLLALPLTATVGPIATFNLLCVACPALAAWTAFLLCHSLTQRFGPSLLGGYIFGFSSYMLAQMFGGHLNLLAAFLLPLAVYLVLARLQGRIERRAFTLGLLALATAQFLITTEVLATMTIFGALALAAAWMMGESESAPAYRGVGGADFSRLSGHGDTRESVPLLSVHRVSSDSDLLAELAFDRSAELRGAHQNRRARSGDRSLSPSLRRLYQRRRGAGRLRWTSVAGDRRVVHARAPAHARGETARRDADGYGGGGDGAAAPRGRQQLFQASVVAAPSRTAHRPGAPAAFHGLPVPDARGANRHVAGRAAAPCAHTYDRRRAGVRVALSQPVVTRVG